MSETVTSETFVAYCMHCGRGVNPGDFLCCPQPSADDAAAE